MSHTPLRLALVTPRYFSAMIGGAEMLLKGYAEQLQARGHDVEVLTTCVRRHFPVVNEFAPGAVTVDGVRVRRFRADFSVVERFSVLHHKLQTTTLSYREVQQLLANQLTSSELCDYLRTQREQYDLVLIAPLPFGVTIAAAQAAADRAVWIPCLHDEPFAYTSIVREQLESARGILFNTSAEETFARQQLKLRNPATAVVGMGIEPAPEQVDGPRFREQHAISGTMLFYAGRLLPQKNVPLLIEYVQRFRREVAADLTLVLSGEASSGVDTDVEGVLYVGELAREELYAAYAAADLFCQPSLNESFSIVLMEAWQQGRPVLVHADCPVTHMHVERSGGGWMFRDFTSFAQALQVVRTNAAVAHQRGAAGRAYVAENYGWDRVIKRLEAALAQFLAPQPLAAELAQRGIRRALEFTRERYEARMEALIEEVVPAGTAAAVAQPLLNLLQHAQIGLPDYAVQSELPVVGDLIEWVRRQSTAHIKEPYLDVIIEQQNHFNATLIEQLQRIFEQQQRYQRMLERRIRQLEQQLSTLTPTDQPHSAMENNQ